MPDDDRRWDAPPDDGDWAVGIVVPDDIRELHEDVAAYRREVRARRRRELQRRVTGTALWRRVGAPTALIACVVATIGAITALMLLLRPGENPALVPAQPLVQTAVPAGRVGGLLPAVTLRTSDGAVDSLEIRPAVIALLPPRCHCSALVNDLAGQAQEFNLPLVVVGPGHSDPEVFALQRDATRGWVQAALDPAGALAGRFQAAGVTVLLLAPDGRVTAVLRNATTQVRLEPQLTAMLPAAG